MLRKPEIHETMALAGVSNCSAAFITNPVDVWKIRCQLAAAGTREVPQGIFVTASNILRQSGPLGFYRGLSASLLREGSYSTLRLGLYEPVKRALGASNSDGEQLPLFLKIASGAVTGCIGSAIAVPFDLVKVRMQACTSSPPRYDGVLFALREIYSLEGGLRGLWRGFSPTVQRGVLLTMTQLPAYDHSKHTLLQLEVMEEGRPLHFVCSIFAGIVTAAVTSPVDVAKTRIMVMSDGKAGYPLGMVRVLGDIIRNEGLRGLYKGFNPNWVRIGPVSAAACYASILFKN
jgi:hypothetical protein